MASKSKRFIDSPEEFELKRILQILTSVTLERCIFINSIISSCNGMKSQRFSSANVSLQEDVDLQQFRENGTGSLQHLILSCRDILMMDILRKVSDGGVKEIPGELDFIFLALLEFLKGDHQDIDSHKESMLRYRHQGALKSDVIKVTAVHLFSQLIPSCHVEVDDESSKSNLCPCSCGRKIQLSCTGIGSPLTWHGNTDIIVNQEIPVLVLEERLEEVDKRHLEKKTDIIIQESVKMANEGVSSVHSEGEKLAETESEEEEPSLRKVRKKIGKKRKISDIYDRNEEEGSDFNTAETSFGRMVKDGDESVDDRTVNRSSQDAIRRKEMIESVLTETVLGHLIAQTISNAFVQVNKNESLSGLMIPSMGINHVRQIKSHVKEKNVAWGWSYDNAMVVSNIDNDIVVSDLDNALVVGNLDNAMVVNNLDNAMVVSDLDNAMVVSNRDNVMVVSNLDNTMIVGNIDNAMVVSNLDNVMVVSNLDNVMIVSTGNLGNVMVVSNLDNAMVVNNLDNAMVVSNLDNAMVESNLDNTMVVSNLDMLWFNHDNAMVVCNLDNAMVVNNLDNAMVVSYLDNAMVVSNRDNTMVVSNLDNAMVVSNRDNATVVSNLDSVMVVSNHDNVMVVSNLDNAMAVSNLDNAMVVSNLDNAMVVSNLDNVMVVK
ncbi:hypothetical protein FSP39_024014 [Pinctada imbricata]|uniref:Uncharacterized protein n=1 Tax=Pinctada imbricata TaxID=66713 RepID=A0AA88YU13_PINIB|nr:hypothetical protein FSP39_024014 [Pinctada imbricata]